MPSDAMTLDLRRRFFAEEIEAVARLRSIGLVEALAAVPRERFLPPGPWVTMADADFMSPGRHITTPDADPKRVYHNIGIAIDPARQLFNGQPGTLATLIDALALASGQRVLHVGAGLGYYTAIMAHCVGANGRVVAYEVDGALAARARENLAPLGQVEVRAADASQPLNETFDAILVNAGVTHPLETWLEAMAPGGRLVLPITAAMPAMGVTLGKGLTWLITREAAHTFSARAAGIVAIYSAVGVRSDPLNERVGKAMMAGPTKWQAVTRLRRDPHDAGEACWLHGDGFCLSA
ncbi:MAG TPA: methyltransferase domain-containing protein [Vicinamibacterales bacterium]|nr:methyltransferase domain-containing protein [Vicinamibacterales bacterium]